MHEYVTRTWVLRVAWVVFNRKWLFIIFTTVANHQSSASKMHHIHPRMIDDIILSIHSVSVYPRRFCFFLTNLDTSENGKYKSQLPEDFGDVTVRDLRYVPALSDISDISQISINPPQPHLATQLHSAPTTILVFENFYPLGWSGNISSPKSSFCAWLIKRCKMCRWRCWCGTNPEKIYIAMPTFQCLS